VEGVVHGIVEGVVHGSSIAQIQGLSKWCEAAGTAGAAVVYSFQAFVAVDKLNRSRAKASASTAVLVSII
jgi:hypothetical protein